MASDKFKVISNFLRNEKASDKLRTITNLKRNENFFKLYGE